MLGRTCLLFCSLPIASSLHATLVGWLSSQCAVLCCGAQDRSCRETFRHSHNDVRPPHSLPIARLAYAPFRTSILCDPHDALLHIATEDSGPTLLSFNNFTPPTVALPKLPLMFAADLAGDGFETPFFSQPDSSWNTSASSQVMSYGPVIVPARPSPAGDGTQQNIGVYLQSRAREAAAALKPIEERYCQLCYPLL